MSLRELAQWEASKRREEEEKAEAKLEDYVNPDGRLLIPLDGGPSRSWGMVSLILYWKENVPLGPVLAFLLEKHPGCLGQEVAKTDVVVTEFDMECDCGVERRTVACYVRFSGTDGDSFVDLRQEVRCRSRNLVCVRHVASFWISPEEMCPRGMERARDSGSLTVEDQLWYFWRE
jgi:hypothetical protein